MNKILCFDVSNNSCSVAISEGQNILSFEQELRPSMQAERLMVMIENVLKNAHMQYQDLDYLAVTVGSGSFTGIRIGLAAAKGILYASKIKGVAITNFEATYYRLTGQVQNYDTAIILLNAYRSQVYMQIFAKDGAQEDPKLIDNNSIRSMLESMNGKIVCAGSGLSTIYSDIRDLENIIMLPRFPTIKAIHIARYADDKINKGIINPIEPLYIRPPNAIIPK